MSLLRLFYLGLAIAGTILPLMQFYLFLKWFDLGGQGPMSLLMAWFANPAVTGLALDLIISALALILWIVAEVAVRRNFTALIAIPATLLIGVSCGLPLYLFLRTRPVG